MSHLSGVLKPAVVSLVAGAAVLGGCGDSGSQPPARADAKASPTVGPTRVGPIVGPTRVGDLTMDVSTEADVRAFAGKPDVVDDHSPYRYIKRLGYNCRERDDCRTEYEINRGTDRLIGFATYSKRFRTRRGTRVGDTREQAERNERQRPPVSSATTEPARSCTRTRYGSFSLSGECGHWL